MTRITVPLPLRWGDQDAYGHVNNATMFRLHEEARIRAFVRDDHATEQAPAAALEVGASASTLSLIGGHRIEYLRPLPYLREPILIETWIGRIGAASIDICYEVRGPEGTDEIFARALTNLVIVDAASGRPTRISDDLRELWAPYIEEPVSFRR